MYAITDSFQKSIQQHRPAGQKLTTEPLSCCDRRRFWRLTPC
ncbi:hypothetical protein SynRCC2555_01104 [Synechococcus sp. WH 8101]|nr:hypothetical protein SynRCC2555_01104 [Synechococcus sp. WH 8101]